MLQAGSGEDRDDDDIPGYSDLGKARQGALTRIENTRAESLTGLQVKAKTFLMDGVSG